MKKIQADYQSVTKRNPHLLKKNLIRPFLWGKPGLTQLLELLIEPGRNLHMFNGEFLPYITAYVIIA